MVTTVVVAAAVMARGEVFVLLRKGREMSGGEEVANKGMLAGEGISRISPDGTKIVDFLLAKLMKR